MKRMKRRLGCEILVALVTLLHVLLCVCTSASGSTKFDNHEEQLRRNLLANGLGTTPPMGYVYMYNVMFIELTKYEIFLFYVRISAVCLYVKSLSLLVLCLEWYYIKQC